MGKLHSIAFAVATLGAVALTYVGTSGLQSSLRASTVTKPQGVSLQTRQGQFSASVVKAELAAQSVAAANAQVRPEDGYYAQLRSKIQFVETKLGGEKILTPDSDSRMLLAKSAAQRARLHEVGLGFKDVYGIINAETSWLPRAGASKDGTPNLGIAQFEPATARALGLRDPNDLVEAIHVAARHMKEAALWSAERIAGLPLAQDQRAEKLREGVSIYYNLSSRGRSIWNGNNTANLPIETKRHIMNARIGAEQALQLEAQLQAVKRLRSGTGVVLASLAQRPS